MTLERISAFITYCIAVVLAWLGDLSIKDASTLGGLMIGVLMLATGSVRRLGSLFADMGGNSGSTGCVNSEWPALAGVKGIFAEDNYPKRKRIYQLGDAIADCCKSRMDGVGYYPGLLSTDRYCLLDHP